MTKETYTIDWDGKASIEVCIDRDVLTDETMNEINNFWSGAKDRLEYEEGNLLNTVLKLLFRHFIYHSFNSIDPIGDFKTASPEGWYPLDGSYGIELLAFSEIDIDAYDIDITLELR